MQKVSLKRYRDRLAGLVAALSLMVAASVSYAQTTPVTALPDVGFDKDGMVSTVGLQVGPLLGSVLLVALSLAVIVFGARKIMRFVTGRA